MFPAPGSGGLQFQVKHRVVPLRKLENFFQSRNSFASEFAAKPGARVQAAQVRQRERVHLALTIGRPIYGVVVNRYKASVARKLQIGLDETRSERDRALECRQGILRRMAGCAAM